MDFTIHIPMGLIYAAGCFAGLIVLWIAALKLPVRFRPLWGAKVTKVHYRRKGFKGVARPFRCDVGGRFCLEHNDYIPSCNVCRNVHYDSVTWLVPDEGSVYPEDTRVVVVSWDNIFGYSVGRKLRLLPGQPKRQYLPQEFKTQA